ncbi:TIGR01459 family HAD-type hydrolase [Rhizobium sp. KVB221]|uniref:TIGR01459 family HAD-type hydrolase n=1 Tax=Rhizobium setariae TaxID=2801340 RepID=A0A937CIZ8_9HYPH|nr:TIGR01459 family HAD-type hydrolase [Rhizobium setariae]MBL0370580.1 TIGR01459 family HAD-type hydrolase [Rhizobium setariae]
MAERIGSLNDIVKHYDVILCDVWGVLHNGVSSFADASIALRSAREAGLSVVLITNSPRPGNGVIPQLESLGVLPEAYDRMVTSGDVTRKLIAEGPGKVYFIGADRETSLLEGLDVECVDEEQAEVIVCTGFVDDEVETPEDYREVLTRLASRNIPMICANPDLVVERGHRLVPCAGAIAALYTELGGTSRIAGKPHKPIYVAALDEALSHRGPFDKNRVLAVGDGMPTDVLGAITEGLDLLYISAGIHGRDYMDGAKTDVAALEAFLDSHNARPRWWMPRLQ